MSWEEQRGSCEHQVWVRLLQRRGAIKMQGHFGAGGRDAGGTALEEAQ